MSTINKIQISGVTYDLGGSGGDSAIKIKYDVKTFPVKGVDYVFEKFDNRLKSIRPGDIINLFYEPGYEREYTVLSFSIEGRDDQIIYFIDDFGDVRYFDPYEEEDKIIFKVASSGGAGLDDDTDKTISAALNDLENRKADRMLLKNYQLKGDYVDEKFVNDELSAYKTIEEDDKDSKVISAALNHLNENAGGGGGSSNIVEITQSEYDALDPKAEDTLYVISDAEEVDPSEFATKDELSDKQDKMTGNYLSKVDVGGSSISIETKSFNGEIVQKTDNINFKTINGQAIFGMGDIKINTDNLVTKDEFNSTVGNIEELLSKI